jgi:hypothetical protein
VFRINDFLLFCGNNFTTESAVSASGLLLQNCMRASWADMALVEPKSIVLIFVSGCDEWVGERGL